jgi:hypothetical protein
VAVTASADPCDARSGGAPPAAGRPARPESHPARPTWKETVAILVLCAVAFVALSRADRAAYEREMARARTALAEQAREAALHPPAAGRRVVEPKRVTARTESLGDRGPIAIPLGGAWSAGTTSTVADIAPRSRRTESAEPALRRIVGPVVAIEEPGRTDAASSSTAIPTPTPAREADSARAATEAGSISTTAAATSASFAAIALSALGLAGVAMVLAGLVVLWRSRAGAQPPPDGVTR